MTSGQFWTVFTMGFSAAVGLLGVSCGVLLFFWHEPVWRLAAVIGPPYGHLMTPLYLALILAASGCVLAYWIFNAQQSLVHWLANRAIARFNDEFRALEQTHGTSAATQMMQEKLERMMLQSSAPFGVFDARPIQEAIAKNRPHFDDCA